MRDDDVIFNTFDWDKYRGTPLYEVAEYVLAWAKKAYRESHYSRGDYRYSLELILVYLGSMEVQGFLIRRVIKVFSSYSPTLLCFCPIYCLLFC